MTSTRGSDEEKLAYSRGNRDVGVKQGKEKGQCIRELRDRFGAKEMAECM